MCYLASVINVEKVLDKKPDIHDLLAIFKESTLAPMELARELHLSHPARDKLKEIEDSTSRIEGALNEWFQEQPRNVPVTWRAIINVLKELRRIDLARAIQVFLNTPKNYSKYSERKDFEPFVQIL